MGLKFLEEIKQGIRSASLKKDIICYYINNGDDTLADLGKELNFSVPTVTKMVGELIEDGIVMDFGKMETPGGRRPNIYGLNQSSGYFIGVDISQKRVHIGLINFKGDLIDEQMDISFEEAHPHERFERLCEIIEDFMSHTVVPKDKILSIGINISGRVNPQTGHSYSFFYFDERPLTEMFEEKLGIDVSIDNDSRAMAYGEYIKGRVQAEKNIIYVNVGWGLGLGIIVNGQLYYGKSGFSGEFGHITAFENEILCHCGKKGCLETEASGSALYRKFLEKLHNGQSSLLTQQKENEDEITLNDIIDVALQEDILAIELIEEVGNTLGKHVAGLINLFNPELVIIGGTLANAGDYLILPLRSAIKKYSLNLVNKDSSIKVSKLGDKAGLLGASLLARSKFIGLI
ncbi:ROK family transcriptional regulator [Capnocytophaga ochracea]|jgi:ROK family protein|uniref:ROK family transcriptional regulator n=1 Tax=Capnocytophaga TaxID=1016 RepID=UPI0015C0D181|nr:MULTISPECIES: ROK family transcriptional regulator [Capnocytophaga]MDU6658580.1 ROK family transcriptional regulator [Capnocytophaga sp.]MEB3016178.1 ROK family transcriptional regulator [Capnocytophaga ochracea]MEB3036293.1 ROK family transcriptional regulator [Capnocytophaga ochracea]QLF49688.1 ROK family transcriptional regulator [Capnocytophaga sp. oral taxon 902]UZD39507.1 ROK family transcriptional regulator [Capnocytophaga ochracea]